MPSFMGAVKEPANQQRGDRSIVRRAAVHMAPAEEGTASRKTAIEHRPGARRRWACARHEATTRRTISWAGRKRGCRRGTARRGHVDGGRQYRTRMVERQAGSGEGAQEAAAAGPRRRYRWKEGAVERAGGSGRRRRYGRCAPRAYVQRMFMSYPEHRNTGAARGARAPRLLKGGTGLGRRRQQQQVRRRRAVQANRRAAQRAAARPRVAHQARCARHAAARAPPPP